MDYELIEKKKEQKRKLFKKISKTKPFMGVVFDIYNEKMYFQTKKEFINIIHKNKIKTSYIIETIDGEYNKKMITKASKIIKDLTNKHPFMILNGYNLTEPILEQWYNEHYNLDSLVGFTKEELDYDKEKTSQYILESLKNMGVVIEKGNKKNGFIGGPIVIPTEEGEVKTTFIRF